jgi:hypothetical protein
MSDFNYKKRPNVGDLVLIQDHSECHGETATVYSAHGDFIIVELHGEDEGTLWPCLYAELHIMEGADKARKA